MAALTVATEMGFFGDEGEVDDGDVGGGDAHGEAVELAVHGGDDEA